MKFSQALKWACPPVSRAQPEGSKALWRKERKRRCFHRFRSWTDSREISKKCQTSGKLQETTKKFTTSFWWNLMTFRLRPDFRIRGVVPANTFQRLAIHLCRTGSWYKSFTWTSEAKCDWWRHYQHRDSDQTHGNGRREAKQDRRSCTNLVLPGQHFTVTQSP